MEDESFIKRIYNLVHRMRTMVLVNILGGIGLTVLVFGLFFSKYEGDTIQGTLIALCFFFVGLSELPIIIRKEVNYTIVSFDGFPAVLIGSIISLAGFMVSTGLLIGILRSLAK